jgi:RNA polymerase sigma factor (sigma-70 family)
MQGWDTCEGVLRRAHEAGRLAHGDLALSFQDFTDYVQPRLGRRLERSGLAVAPLRVGTLLGADAAADLFLAAACDAGVEGAWERLAELHDARLRGLLRHWGATAAEAEQLADELPGELATPPPRGGARTRIGTFDASGSLAAWLAVVARRRWADLARAETRGDPARPIGEHDPAPASPPLQKLVDDETAARLSQALAETWPKLTPREALALLYRYADGLPQTRIAALMGVGEPRVSRLLKKALSRLRAGLQHLMEPLGNDHALRAAIERHMATFPRPRDPRSRHHHG